MQPTHRESLAVIVASAIASLIALHWYYAQGSILYYGDAVAHITIARRVFDSLHPGLSQFGTVWLPLPHLLILPFVISDHLWSSGIGGSFYSMASYMFAVWGLFRLLRPFSRLWAWGAAILFGANPNLLYMQSTAMTEPLSLALAIWALVYLMEWRAECAASGSKKLFCMALCVAAGMLTRYDAWFAAMFLGAVVMGTLANRWKKLGDNARTSARRALVFSVLVCLLIPLGWLLFNQAIYGNAFDFLNGPYSAKAISARAIAMGVPPFPGATHPWVAWLHFFKAAKLDFADGAWELRSVVIMVAGVVLLLVRKRAAWPLLLLWLPCLFYVYSIAYGGVTMYVPTWYPFTSFNARYGLHLLPAFAVFFTLPLALMAESKATWKRTAGSVTALLLAVATLQSVWNAPFLCFTEAESNSRARRMADAQIVASLKQLPPGSTLFMSFQEHIGALQAIAFPLRRTINETSKEDWTQGLSAPAAAADYVLAFEGDPVAAAVKQHPQGLAQVVTFTTAGEPPGVLYKSLRTRP